MILKLSFLIDFSGFKNKISACLLFLLVTVYQPQEEVYTH
jgi:hypothetical protein